MPVYIYSWWSNCNATLILINQLDDKFWVKLLELFNLVKAYLELVPYYLFKCLNFISFYGTWGTECCTEPDFSMWPTLMFLFYFGSKYLNIRLFLGMLSNLIKLNFLSAFPCWKCCTRAPSRGRRADRLPSLCCGDWRLTRLKTLKPHPRVHLKVKLKKLSSWSFSCKKCDTRPFSQQPFWQELVG